MPSSLYNWALEERYEITESLKWFNAGAKLLSPSGDDITGMKIGRLNKQLEELDKALREADHA